MKDQPQMNDITDKISVEDVKTFGAASEIKLDNRAINHMETLLSILKRDPSLNVEINDAFNVFFIFLDLYHDPGKQKIINSWFESNDPENKGKLTIAYMRALLIQHKTDLNNEIKEIIPMDDFMLLLNAGLVQEKDVQLLTGEENIPMQISPEQIAKLKMQSQMKDNNFVMDPDQINQMEHQVSADKINEVDSVVNDITKKKN